MRWSAIGLMTLGVFAALGASLVVTSVRGTRETSAAEGDPVVAPPGDEGEPVVAPPEDEGEPVVAPPDFEAPTQGETGAHLASALQPGMRAMGITLEQRMDGLIEPGSVVDVFASVEMDGQSVSMNLLQSVVVLAVDIGARAPSDAGHSVVLLVDSKQVESLLLALEKGSVSLALRNPSDGEEVSRRGTRLSELPSAAQRSSTAPAVRRPVSRQREVVVIRGDQTRIETVPSEDPENGE